MGYTDAQNGDEIPRRRKGVRRRSLVTGNKIGKGVAVKKGEQTQL